VKRYVRGDDTVQVAKGAEILEGGRIKWTGRKVMRRKKGGPLLALPPELKGWIGRSVELELRSERELVVRLMEEECGEKA